MSPEEIDRRFLLGAALASAAVPATAAERAAPRAYRGDMPWTAGAADAPTVATPGDFQFFIPGELAFVMPALDRLIPPDPTGPSAVEADVHVFLDRQLAGPYGQGDHFYLGGPWPPGVPEQGYQSRFAPAQLYRLAVAEIERVVEAERGARFGRLPVEDQDAVLKALEAGELRLEGVDGAAFFALFLQNAREGYFSDPLYGGNKGMAAWKMIGFPGAHYDYSQWATRHGERVPFPTVGILGRPGWSRT